jgi:hypothetical protein
MTVRIASMAAVVAAASLVAGCGSDDTPSTTEWAGDVCTAVSTWADSLTQTASSLQGGNISEDSLRNAADEAKSATDTLVDDLKGLGAPDTEAGSEAKDSIDKLADGLEQQADTIESAADDVSGVSGVLGAISTVTGALGAMGTEVSSTFAQLQQLDAAGELKQAFQDSSSCQDLSALSP